MAGKLKHGKYVGAPCKYGHDGWRYKGGMCVSCAAERSRQKASTPEGREKKRLAYWKDGGKEYRRERNLLTAFGISLADYNRMMEGQGYSCMICGIERWETADKNFHVDHCHLTGKVRGLLCHLCNVGLGSFKDDPVRLQKAIDYLTRV